MLLSDYPSNLNILTEMGKLMYASHESYSAVGLGNEKTDQIVEEVTNAGAPSGLYGARVSGGGNGGTVAILGTSNNDAVREIQKKLEHKWNSKLHFFNT